MNQTTLDQRLAVRHRPNNLQWMHQRWENLAFFHWEFNPEAVQSLLPAGLSVDLFGGKAWVGLVPFRMEAIRPVGLPPLPWVSYFLEMNLRTYVIDELGRPGVWFFSLDCNQPIAVRIARGLFHLPYFDAKMSHRTPAAHEVEFCVQRRGFAPDRYSYRFGPDLPAPSVESLEFFLLERYLLFAWDARKKRLRCGQVHHQPYRPVEVELLKWSKAPFEQAGLPAPTSEPQHQIAAHGVQVQVFGLK